jgi:hypothetical protein
MRIETAIMVTHEKGVLLTRILKALKMAELIRKAI